MATYRVAGMTCGGCSGAVERAIKAVAPEAQVDINLSNGAVKVEGATEAQVKQAVDDAGFDYQGVIG